MVSPGIGTLTMALLAQGAQVYAIEKDQKLIEPLNATFKDEPNFTLIAADALEGIVRDAEVDDAADFDQGDLEADEDDHFVRGHDLDQLRVALDLHDGDTVVIDRAWNVSVKRK